MTIETINTGSAPDDGTGDDARTAFTTVNANFAEIASGHITNGTVQTLYNAQVVDGFTGSLFVGTGGGSLSYASGSDGHYNTGLGIGALLGLTTGNRNNALGSTALNGCTTGQSNSAVGQSALLNLTSGSYNVGIGHVAGRSAITGTNTTGSNSIFIGNDTRSAADGETNQIVIGDTAEGAGSNTATLGNDSITKTLLKGVVQLSSVASNYRAITSTDTVLVTDSTVNATTGTFVLTLETAVGNTGLTHNLKNSGAGVVTINTTSSQTIDGGASGSITLSQYDNITVQSNGANWIIL